MLLAFVAQYGKRDRAVRGFVAQRTHYLARAFHCAVIDGGDHIACLELVEAILAIAQHQHAGLGTEVVAEAGIDFGQAQPAPAERLTQPVEAAVFRFFGAPSERRDACDFHLDTGVDDAVEPPSAFMARVRHHGIAIVTPHHHARHRFRRER